MSIDLLSQLADRVVHFVVNLTDDGIDDKCNDHADAKRHSAACGSSTDDAG